MTNISSDLIKAYHATHFTVLEPRRFTLRVQQKSSELVELYGEMGVSSAGYLTACNPYSAETSAEDNAAAQLSLIRRLEEEGYPTLEALGEDPAGKWPGEESVFVPGLGLEKAKALGTEFRQNAIVWAGDDAIPQLIPLR